MYLRTFRYTNDKKDLESYLDHKKAFKLLCQTKKEDRKKCIIDELKEACADPNSKSFWQKIKSLTAINSRGSNKISPRKWYDYFKNLLVAEENIKDEGFEQEVSDTLRDHNPETCEKCKDFDYDKEITETEILKAIKITKRVKLLVQKVCLLTSSTQGK